MISGIFSRYNGETKSKLSLPSEVREEVKKNHYGSLFLYWYHGKNGVSVLLSVNSFSAHTRAEIWQE